MADLMSDTRDKTKKQEEIRVIDRRSFTTDGSLRNPDAPRDDAPDTLADFPGPSESTREKAGRKGAGAEGPAQGTGDDSAASAQFQNMILNLARQAAASLGLAKNPFTGQIEVDLEGAHQIIDLLQALRIKTRGNLTAEEAAMFEGLIGDLQMQYVTAKSRPSKTP